MEIKKLPENVKSIIQSGVVISDACQCVLELLYNSLDSKANAIAVRIDFKKFYLQVVDNGSGISYDDLKTLGDRHVTSKCSSLEDLEDNILTYGYRGISLPSITDMCGQVEIQSRHSSCQSTYTRILKSSGSHELHENQRTRPTHGTTVTVVNFMVSMPVRRKRIKEVFDLDFIVQQIEALSTIHYSVSFSLRNDTTGKVIMQTYRRNTVHQSLLDHFGLAIEKNLIPVNFRDGSIEVSGFVSRHLHTDCSIQFVYVNNRVINNPKIHKLILDLIKKYGHIWERDRVNPEEVIDVDGFIYIIKIQSPYIIFSMFRNGRKTVVEFRNTEDVLKCIIRAIKRRLKAENNGSVSDISVYFDDPVQESKKIGNPLFGPSQMNNVVHGRLVSRPLGNLEECIIMSKVEKENLEEKIVSLITPKYNTTTPSSILQRYQKEFFNYNNKDGSNLPDHIPIFEMRDFSNIPFHEFLAWLRIKAKRDDNAFKLLSELTSCNFSITNEKPGTIVSLKDIRKNKLVASGKIMLKKIQEIRYSQTQRFLKNNQKNSEIFNSVTRTTLTSNYPRFSNFPGHSVVSTENKSFEFPQVSFNEFLTWLKVKATHNRTVEKFLSDFFSAKGYNKNQLQTLPQKSIKELRKERLHQLNNELLTTLKENNIKSHKRHLPLTSENRGRKKPKIILENNNPGVINTTAGCNNHNSSLVLTWKSHYRTDSVRLTKDACKEALVHSPKNDSIRVCDLNISHGIIKDKDTISIPSREITSHLPFLCNDILPISSQQSINIAQIQCHDIPILNCSPKQPYIAKPDLPSGYLSKQFHEIAIQTSLNVANASVQVDSEKVYVSSTTQTDEQKFGIDKEVQTATPENICKEINGGQFSMKTVNTSSSELPEVLKQSDLYCSPSILRNSLPDTVPIISGWEEKIDNTGRKYFVHSSSGYSIFDPPISSTRSSFPISNVNPGNDLSKNFEQVRNVVTDSCQDDLSEVKWQDGNKDDVIDPILKILQDASEDGCIGSEIMSAKIPKQFINSHKLLSPIVFSKEHLKAAKVIGQLDRKFIVTIVPKDDNSKCSLVCLFDQHGVHERITLEKLLKIYQNVEKCESEYLQTPIIMSVPLSTYNLFLSEQQQFNKQGLYGVAQNTLSISITSVPACFVRQQEREVKAYRKPSLMRKVANLIEEISDHLCETRGAGLLIPKTTMAVIASEACRTAIKFNQTLTVEEMLKMITDLSLCNMPFQCAHGRPSVTPIFEIDKCVISNNANKLNFKNIKTKK